MYNLRSFLACLQIILILILSGCDSDKVVNPSDSSSSKLLFRIISEAEEISSTFYTTNGDLTKIETTKESEIVQSRVFEYNSDGLPVSVVITSDSEVILSKFYYGSSSKLDSIQNTFQDSLGNQMSMNTVKYSYNESDQLAKEEYFTSDHRMIYGHEYIYSSNGNIVESREYDSNGLTFISSMQYDDKVNPLHAFRDCLLFESTISPNNILQRTITLVQSDVVSATNYAYEYDEDGYPISFTVDMEMADGTISTNTQTYEYK